MNCHRRPQAAYVTRLIYFCFNSMPIVIHGAIIQYFHKLDVHLDIFAFH